jgi:hypothetical protein
LSFGYDGGNFEHASTVSIGTWRAEFFIPEKGGITILIGFLAAELDAEAEKWTANWVSIENQSYTKLKLHEFSGDAKQY